MKKLLSLLLLTPILVFAQELPDEDWVCVTSHQQQSNLLSTGDLENRKIDNLPNFLFNPSKGYRLFQWDDFSPQTCSATETITKSDMYVCTNTIGGNAYIFQMDIGRGTFNYVDSHTALGQSVSIFMGECTKP
jgi:hypothetical protein